MINLNRLKNPAMYQGQDKTNTYFEGWYYKIVDTKKDLSIAIIPGISKEVDGASHAFIQVLINSSITHYFTYPVEAFIASPHSFCVQVGESIFSHSSIHLDIISSDFTMEGDLNFSNEILWSKNPHSLGTMGVFSLFPFMECYHHMLSLIHKVHGELKINGEIINLNNSIGYTEKDWGRSFPSAWIWLQCNHFEDEDMAVMTSIAKIPFIGINFCGFLCQFYCGGQSYHFTTYNGSTAKVSQKNGVTLELSNLHHRLIIQLNPNYTGGNLPAPRHGSMSSNVVESINEKISLSFYEKIKGKWCLITTGNGTHAGLELSNIEEILTK